MDKAIAAKPEQGDIAVRHALPGRTRLALASWPDAERLNAVRRRLAQLGCTLVSARRETGTLLIRHDAAQDARRLGAWVRTALEGEPDPRVAPGLEAAIAGSAADALRRLRTRRDGLRPAEIRTRLRRYGPNALPDPQPRSASEIFVAQFTTLPVALLAGSAALSLMTGGLFDAAVTIAVVLVNAGIGYSSEDATERLIRRLTRPIERRATVIRDGVRVEVAARELVPGDILVLGPGAAIGADARLIEVQGLAVDESALTGESLPVEKHAEAMREMPGEVAGRGNIVHRGTIVTGGGGLAVVVRTGWETEVARTRALIGAYRPPRPPSEEKLEAMGRQLVWACLAASAGIAGIGLLRGQPLVAIARNAVAIAVSAIPEGLPAISTTALAHGARRLEQAGAFVRALPAVEALGGIDTICLDKTGTLTENRMRVAAAHVQGRLHRAADDGGFAPQSARELVPLARAVVLCNEARLEDRTGSGTETALLRFAAGIGLDPDSLQQAAPILRRRTRDAAHRWMATEHADGSESLLFLKGAPDELLGRCEREQVDGTRRPLTERSRAEIAEVNRSLARQGLRVLGVATRRGPIGEGHMGGLDWLGLVALADPVRAEAGEAIAVLHRAGIRTVMITGDQRETALAVAEQLALSRNGILNVADEREIAALDEAQLGELARHISVFARIDPAEKLRVVRALQAAGHRVAMIGDGVNDGPALRAASVGVAMGRQGTDVAREIADIVIGDDDLGALVRAIARGRASADGMRLAVRFLLATNLAEMALMLVEAVGGGALETPMELFWMNLGTDVFPALGLALSPSPEPRMARPPSDPAQPLFDRFEMRRMGRDAAAIAAAPLAVHFLLALAGRQVSEARGATFLAMALAQMGHALVLGAGGDARDDRAPLTAAIGASTGLLTAPLLLSPLRRLLGIALPPPGGLLLASGAAVLAAAATGSGARAIGPS